MLNIANQHITHRIVPKIAQTVWVPYSDSTGFPKLAQGLRSEISTKSIALDTDYLTEYKQGLTVVLESH